MEIGTLSASFTAETRDFDSKLKASEVRLEALKTRIREVQREAASPFKGARLSALQDMLRGATRDHRLLQNAQRQTAAGARAMGADLQGALSALSPRLAGVAGAAGPLAAVAAGLVAIGAAGVGIYKLATFSQQLGAEIFDLSQKINFSAETLSSLKVAAELSGGSLASLSTSLGIFDRNMEEAKDQTSEMAGIFKVLKIETDDNEKALRRAFTVLGNLKGSAQQTAIAMKLFGRSGKEVLGIIKETGGDVDGFIKKMEAMGLTITKDGAKKADEFGDSLKLLQLKLEAIARQIGTELVPTVSKAADDISRWLKENQGEIVKTAKELGSLISGFYQLAKAVASPFVAQVIITRKFVDFAKGGIPGAASSIAGDIATGLGLVTPGPSKLQPQWSDTSEFAQGAVPQEAGPIVFPKRGGGRGGGGKSRLDEALRDQKRLDELLLANIKARLDSEEGEVSRSYDRREIIFQEYFTESIRLETERYDALKANLVKEEQAAQKLVDTKGGLKAQIVLQEAINALKEEEFRHGERLAEIAKEQRQHQEAIADSLDEQKDRLNDMLLSALGISQALSELGTVSTAAGALERFMEKEPPDISAQTQAILDMRERMRDLGHELTGIFHESIGVGFEQGVKRGLVTLAQGLLDIVQNVFLKRLAEGLGNILADFATPSSGKKGGLLSGILGAIVSGIGGGIGGGAAVGGAGSSFGSAFAGGFAKGGFVPGVDKGFDSIHGMLTPGELVLNKKQQGMLGTQVVNNYHINVQPPTKGGYNSPKSQREMANALLAAIQGSQV